MRYSTAFSWCAVLTAFVAPIKLSWYYAAASLLFVLYLVAHTPWRNQANVNRAIASSPLVAPLLLFLLYLMLSSCLGIDCASSWRHILTMCFYALTIFPFATHVAEEGIGKIVTALLFGQTVAALHTVAGQPFGLPDNRFFVGPVTESGQLALVIPLVLSLAFDKPTTSNDKALRFPWRFLAALSSYLLLAFCSHVPALATWRLPLAALALLVTAGNWLSNNRQTRAISFVRDTLLALLLAAFLANLKRGPWAGVFVAGAMFFAQHSLKRLGVFSALAVAFIAIIAPVRERISASLSNFFIYGGRAEIWDIGWYLATTFPLGVGFGNSRVLREFSDQIPPELTHFHNLYLNVWAETGTLGLAIFCFWLAQILWHTLRKTRMEFAIGLSVLAAMVAGIVEYNLGDSEIKTIFMILVGALVGLQLKAAPLTKQIPS